MQTGPLMNLGRYEIKEKIGAGGMAAVYRAVQVGVGGFRSVVAIKILHPHLSKDAQFKKMFLEEARIGALLNHGNLLNILDYGEEEGVSYLVTEYFPSISLEELAEQVKRVPLDEALYILAEAASGLEALHQAKDIDGNKKLGLVHRDVSPHNILIGHDGRVKVIDYGIVKKDDATERTRAGLVKGKVRYMAPEQACGGPVGPASDLYALGVVFLRCVTGQRPHGSGNTAEIMARARTGIELDKAIRRTRIPKSLRTLLDKLLVADARERYSEGSTLSSDVRTLLTQKSPGYDVSRFQAWLQENVNLENPKKKRRRKKGGAKKDQAQLTVNHETGLVRIPPTGEGIHPSWVFLGLAALFGVALVAHLIDSLFG